MQKYVLFLLLFAFALRVYGIDAVQHDFDRAYPHGAGIGINTEIANGQWGGVPLLSLRSNINLPNPAAASFLWAVLTLAPPARDPYIATLLNVALNVMAMAMIFDIGRRWFNVTVGRAALFFAASSLWSVYLAQGVWLQGLLEFCAVGSLWALTRIMRPTNNFGQHRNLTIVLAFTFIALAMQTYLVAFGIALQMFGCINWRMPRTAKLAVGLGVTLCLLGMVGYIVLVFRTTPSILRDLSAGLSNASAGTAIVPNPFGVSQPFAATYHAVGVITGRFYENMWAQLPNSAFGLRDVLSNMRASAIEAIFVLGVWGALRSWRSHGGARVILMWFGLPVLGITLLALILTNLAVFHHYMMITAPAGYMLAGLGASKIGMMMNHTRIPAFGRRVLGVAAILGGVLIPCTNFAIHVSGNRAQRTLSDDLESLTLAQLRQLRQDLSVGCDVFTFDKHPNWVTSVMGDTKNLRIGTARRSNLPHAGTADVWHIPAVGTACFARTAYAIIAPFATVAQPPATHGYEIYRQSANDVLTANPAACDNTPRAVNLGWSQLQVCSTPEINPGGVLHVRHVWQIGGLPPENTGFAQWRYEPFVKVLNAQGQAVAIGEGAGLQGQYWRAGDRVISQLQFVVPATLPKGQYRLELSLFDRQRGENAWWLDPNNLGGARINSLNRALIIN